MEADDRFSFPVFEPVIAGDPSVVLVDLAVTLHPAVVLARADAEPADESADSDLGFLRPEGDEVDDRVASVVGDPPAA